MARAADPQSRMTRRQDTASSASEAREREVTLQHHPILYSTGLFHWSKERRLQMNARTVMGRLARLERRT